MSFASGNVCRVALRADEHEVVVHHRVAPDAQSFGDEFFFRRLVVHEHDVGIAAAREVERLPGAERDDAHLDAGVLLERRQQMREQAGLLRRRGRGHDDELVLRDSAGCQQQGTDQG
jgi:hypothetical protein